MNSIFSQLILEWLGYLASALVVISLMMSSIIRLRWFNLAGALLMCIYGLLIHATPVAVLNLFIVLVDLYYLKQIYFSRDYFNILQPRPESRYLKHFLEFYRQEIAAHIPEFQPPIPKEAMAFFVLRNTVPACLFIAIPGENNALHIKLDFVVPAYRDFKIGRFLFEEKQSFFPNCGFTTLKATAGTKPHARYLRKMGFSEDGREGEISYFSKRLPSANQKDCPLDSNCNCR
ncbi:MAG: GNAT family N-acetyltransferase [Acidobacteria bacterium]|nr:GNAT family N-acetyltransferase [Acidobacteriota bacterium]